MAPEALDTRTLGLRRGEGRDVSEPRQAMLARLMSAHTAGSQTVGAPQRFCLAWHRRPFTSVVRRVRCRSGTSITKSGRECKGVRKHRRHQHVAANPGILERKLN